MSKKRIEFVDYLRGISIFGIVIFHLFHDYMTLPGIIAKLSIFGGAGVHVFNVCSSFGLALSFINRPVSWGEFLKKRFIKIYIPYAIAVTFYFIFHMSMNPTTDTVIAYLSHVFLFKMFVPAYMTSLGGHFWYISTIIQFYLIFLLLMKLRNQIGNKKLLIFSCIVSILWMTLTSLLGIVDNRVWNNFVLQYLWEFGIGIFLADWLLARHTAEIKKPNLWLVALLTIVCSAIYAVTGLSGGIIINFNDVFSLTAISGIYYLIYQIKPAAKLFTRLAGFSYELYLMHILVFQILTTFLNPYCSTYIVGALSLVLSFVVSYGYSIVMQKILRKPLR